ncbi:thiolase family protein [Gulosibacter chungangensis]|uniref:Thiolase family protein n=1 Tax=Gulosibacter chungangensis TaxID=979746 RepID=A0A7J5B7F5_9MICO|nr:thiolase family protein [Gulosibacter chungangensis]KAB1640706.1 thiolase family protein [Gulosibacter chungangensis]
MSSAVIVDVVRLASGRGKPGGALSGTHPVDLLAHVLNALVERNELDPALVDDVIAGCVSQVGEQASNIARNAVLAAGFPESVPATTVDRQCGSSQQAAHLAAQGVIAGAYDIAIAAGVESMSRVPMGSAFAGADPLGPRIAERYPEGLVHQGISAELLAAKWQLTREELDAFAVRSHQLAAAAADYFAGEIVPIEVTDASGETVQHTIDETVRPETSMARLATLESPFRSEQYSRRFPQIDWQITAGSSSPFTDGASAALIMSEEAARKLGLTARARFHSFAIAADDPVEMLSAPIPATKKVLQRSGLTLDEIDTYEVNEAFASVPLMWAKALDTDLEKLNPRGGAIALGHALGSSGTRLLTTMVNHLEATGGRYGLQTMCEGGGMANATIIERL